MSKSLLGRSAAFMLAASIAAGIGVALLLVWAASGSAISGVLAGACFVVFLGCYVRAMLLVRADIKGSIADIIAAQRTFAA